MAKLDLLRETSIIVTLVMGWDRAKSSDTHERRSSDA
jgi:hypothetical protein